MKLNFFLIFKFFLENIFLEILIFEKKNLDFSPASVWIFEVLIILLFVY